jgi:hypothetical protein
VIHREHEIRCVPAGGGNSVAYVFSVPPMRQPLSPAFVDLSEAGAMYAAMQWVDERLDGDGPRDEPSPPAPPPTSGGGEELAAQIARESAIMRAMEHLREH